VLPRLLAKLQAAGASKQVTGVVIPTGYSFNLDGTCIYLTLGALFIVQAAGQDMPLATQIGLLLLMILTSKGAAGITGASLREGREVPVVKASRLIAAPHPGPLPNAAAAVGRRAAGTGAPPACLSERPTLPSVRRDV
jgi:hypothetical protein